MKQGVNLDNFTPDQGMKLAIKVKQTVDYVTEINRQPLIKSKSTTADGFLSRDKFLRQFLTMYTDETLGKKKGPLKDSLIMCLLRVFVAKANGHKNPAYGDKVQNFCLAMSATNNKAFELFSGNLGLMHGRHVKRLAAQRREKSFLTMGNEEVTDNIVKYTEKIRLRMGDRDRTKRITFSAGFDATALVPSFGYIPAENIIVGGAYPQHAIDVSDLTTDEIKRRLKKCNDGECGEKAAEIKICVISFQQTPPGTCPYLILCGLPQSINHNNDWTDGIIKSW